MVVPLFKRAVFSYRPCELEHLFVFTGVVIFRCYKRFMSLLVRSGVATGIVSQYSRERYQSPGTAAVTSVSCQSTVTDNGVACRARGCVVGGGGSAGDRETPPLSLSQFSADRQFGRDGHRYRTQPQPWLYNIDHPSSLLPHVTSATSSLS
ncbi:hypothetical protein J6590_024433 [Homalodisca vitripennis]|nr:hypothetical protein J6590_098716 [Homalodisca vitripennis]KAG8332239.1 hypothetical protein J6590_024433 [Homalodisca vitripennis]